MVRPPNAQDLVLIINHAQVTIDTLSTEYKQTLRKFRLVKARYYNATGLAAHATDYVDVQLKNGTKVMAHWSSKTGDQGSIAAGWNEMVLSATDSDAVLAIDDILTLNLDCSGSPTVPAGKLEVYGWLLPSTP